jgi:hypothetical protein
VSSAVYRDRTCSVCKSTNGLLMWGRYLHIDTSPHTFIPYVSLFTSLISPLLFPNLFICLSCRCSSHPFLPSLH